MTNNTRIYIYIYISIKDNGEETDHGLVKEGEVLHLAHGIRRGDHVTEDDEGLTAHTLSLKSDNINHRTELAEAGVEGLLEL